MQEGGVTKPDRRHRTYGFTDPDVAKRYREKGWKPYANREQWTNGVCRYHGKFELPKERK